MAALTTIGYQAANGYFNFEVGLYLRWIFLLQVPMMFAMAALALSMQVFTNNRLVGWGIMIAFFIVQEVACTIGLEHNLVMYAELPAHTYSDMNGYGHYVRPLFWFNLYWVLVAGVLVVLSVLLLGARHRRARDDEVAGGAQARDTAQSRDARRRRGARYRHRRVDLLQHERPQRLHGLEAGQPPLGRATRSATSSTRGSRSRGSPTSSSTSTSTRRSAVSTSTATSCSSTSPTRSIDELHVLLEDTSS